MRSKNEKTISVLFNGSELRQRLRETISHPPEGIIYKTRAPIEKMKADYAMAKLGNFPKREIMTMELIEKLRIPNIRYIPNKYLQGVDLIHTPNQMLLNKVPWIVEVDNSAGLSFYRTRILYSKVGGRLIRHFLTSHYCKKIICLSEASRMCMQNTFKNEKINKRLEVIYPYVKLNPYRKKPSDKIRLLFITTSFYAKGGRELIAAFKKLTHKYKYIDLTVITAIRLLDQNLLNEAKKYPNLHIHDARYNKEELYRQFYSQADIFVMPTYQDSFGLVYLEAIASGLPIIATDMYALPEIVEEGKNGFLIQSPIKYFNKDFTPNRLLFDDFVDINKLAKGNSYKTVEDGLVEKLSILIEDKKLRNSMGDYSRKLVETGKFSERIRKEKLRKVYEGAIK